MWINKAAYSVWVEQVRTRDAFFIDAVEKLQQQMAAKDAEIKRLIEWGWKLRDLVAKSSEKAAVHAAYSDTWRMRVNELVQERAELLAKIIPGLTVVTPRIENSPILTSGASGIDFEDMGDAAALQMGLADELPVDSMGSADTLRSVDEQLDSLTERLQNPS